MRYFSSIVSATILFISCRLADSRETCLFPPVENDDFCDCSESSQKFDETKTSACSYFDMKYSTQFKCLHSGILNESVPLSRMDDGVCDCCDGSDENSVYKVITCPNTCDEKVANLRQIALHEYRQIQDGIHRKNEIIQQYQNSINDKKKSFSKMKLQRQELSDLLFSMRYLYEKTELPLENHIRFQLIRERQMNCVASLGSDITTYPQTFSYSKSSIDSQNAVNSNSNNAVPGSTAQAVADAMKQSNQIHIGSCDLFYAGYTSSNEFLDYVHTTRYANPPSRMEYRHSEEEIKHMETYTGIERVKATLCLASDLLPDDNPNIFLSLGDYLDHATGITSSKVYSSQLHTKYFGRYIFAPYLDEGQRGYTLAAIVVIEFFSLAISPIIFAVYGIEYLSNMFEIWLWNKLKLIDYHSTDTTYPMEIKQSVDNSDNSDGSDKSDSKESADGKETKHVTDHNPTESFLGYITNLIIDMFEEDIHGLDHLYHNLISGSQHNKDEHKHDSNVADVDNHHLLVDILHNNMLYTYITPFIDAIVLPILHVPRWIATVIYISPWMYLEYYVLNKSRFLPQRRQACLLRAGMTEIDKQIKELDILISTTEQTIANPMSDKSILQSTAHSDPSDDATNDQSNKNKKRSKQNSRSIQSSLSLVSEDNIDYGIDSIWMHTRDICIEKYISNNQKSSYLYKFCFFNHIKQDQTILGKFSSWGLRPMENQSSSKSMSKTSMKTDEYYNYQYYKRGLKCPKAHQSAHSHSFTSSSASSSAATNRKRGEKTEEDNDNLYRNVQVEFQCGAQNEILDVIEIEICVYNFIVRTPFACSESIEEKSLQRLQDLEVFGFTKPSQNVNRNNPSDLSKTVTDSMEVDVDVIQT